MLAELAIALLAVLWTYPPEVQPDHFVVTEAPVGGQEQAYQVAPTAPGACRAIPGGKADEHCTKLACPTGTGVVTYFVQAVIGTQMSEKSPIVTCAFRLGDPACTCIDPATLTPEKLRVDPAPLQVEAPPPMPPTLQAPTGTVTPPPVDPAHLLQLAQSLQLPAPTTQIGPPPIPAMGAG